MSTKPRVLVMGATGQVGAAVILCMKNEPTVEVLAAARTPQKAQHLGLSAVYLDLDRIETLAPALDGIDRTFMVTLFCHSRKRKIRNLAQMNVEIYETRIDSSAR